MKRLLTLLILLTLPFAAYSQSRISAGIIFSHFNNIGDKGITDIKSPVGYGLLAGYDITDEFTVAFTGEYLKGDMKELSGKETDYRAGLTAVVKPFNTELIFPYLSAGFVTAYKKYEYDNLPSSDKFKLYARYGAGVDYKLLDNLSINFDLGVYFNGMEFSGWTNSLGLRIAPNL